MCYQVMIGDRLTTDAIYPTLKITTTFFFWRKQTHMKVAYKFYSVI
jgi:hypothetical protein